MARNSAISTESFEEILAWLNPDREEAGRIYVQLRHDLTKLFLWKGCHDAEGLTDEVIDRVSRKVREVRPTYEGDPRLYFRAVARNLIKEDQKKARTQVSLEGFDFIKQIETRIDDSSAAMDDCLQSCLQKLSSEKRELILAYYAKEKQAKIDHRSELARSLGISVETLRVKVYRIRESLEQCIEGCIEKKASGSCDKVDDTDH